MIREQAGADVDLGQASAVTGNNIALSHAEALPGATRARRDDTPASWTATTQHGLISDRMKNLRAPRQEIDRYQDNRCHTPDGPGKAPTQRPQVMPLTSKTIVSSSCIQLTCLLCSFPDDQVKQCYSNAPLDESVIDREAESVA